MKSDRKSNESSCVPGTPVKEESCSESCPSQDHSSTNNGDKQGEEDSKNCIKESKNDDVSRGNKLSTAHLQSLRGVKVETSPCYSLYSVSNGSKPDTNAIGKCVRNTGSAGESQYMQQQSQIFVFSTMLANKGAEAVLRGQFPSIVAYHSAQPSTKKFLEKNPNKTTKPCQNSNDWLCQLTGSVPKTQPSVSNDSGLPRQHANPMDTEVPPFWTDHSKNGSVGTTLANTIETSVDATIDKVVNSQPSPRSLESGATSSPNVQPSLQGVKVPDENLTPQQRQHREEQLATIRNMRMLLFPNRPEGTAPSIETGQGASEIVPGGMNSLVNSPLDNFSSGVDWDKIQSQLFDVKNKDGTDEPDVAPETTQARDSTTQNRDVPPPYNQSCQRPASVPVGLQSSNPSSPNDPTSTLSLPSPRRGSAVNSPADCNRQYQAGTQRDNSIPGTTETQVNHSNPGTPGSSHPQLNVFSPGGTLPKDSLDFGSGQSPSVDDILCQTLESVGHDQEHGSSVITSQEANLMPVPSPQQIQYLHTFEGQELTIQKQPNTSLKDNDPSSDVGGNNLGSRLLNDVGNQCSAKLETNSPVSESIDRNFSGPLPSPRTPRTPTCGTPNPSLDSSNTNVKTSTDQHSPASFGQVLPDRSPRGPSPPVSKDQRQPPSLVGRGNDCKMPVHSMGQNYAHPRLPMSMRQPENLPLNPNNVGGGCLPIRGNLNAAHFDPITSLAQMSQQFANVTPNNVPGDGQMHPGTNMDSHNPQSMHEMNPPHLGQHVAEFGNVGLGMPPNYHQPRPGMVIPNRMGHPAPGYGPVNPGVYPGGGPPPLRPMDHPTPRATVQVKPGAPNTIQYLPAKANVNPGMPRGPPSLDFLQGFSNVPSNMEPRIPTMPNQRGFPMSSNPGMHNAPMYPGINRPQRPMGYPPMHNPVPGGYPPPRTVRNVHPQMNLQRMQHMVGGAVFAGNRPGMEPPFPGDPTQMRNQINSRMYLPPQNRGCAPGLRARPPINGPPSNVTGGNNFKANIFPGVGPPPSDPNYAQQYHNFQQQLYATTTRHGVPTSQNNPHMATNSPTLMPDR